MRPPFVLVLAFAAPVALSACAGGRTLPTYGEELRQLEADCAARGGILTPTGSQTSRPQRDYACKIAGGASRIPPY
ncbi:hypothetical protein D3C80_1101560 [compost metagenome]|jgi:hypothetical protein